MSFLIIFLLSAILVYGYRKLALKHGILDEPNHRTSHHSLTPRGGGVVFIALWLFAVGLSCLQHRISTSLTAVFILPISLVALVSFCDDYFKLRRRYRLINHFLAALLCVALLNPLSINLFDFTFSPVYFLLFSLVVAITWSINLFNFMDGLDGLASTQSVFIFFVTGCLLYYQGNGELGYLSCLLAFSVLGFLVWNWPNAKIFMGDVGSTSLGLAVAVFMLAAHKAHSLSPMIYLILYLPFICDASLTLLRRVIAGEKWYEAHNRHAFQRLYRSGWSHQQVLLSLIALNVASTSLAILAVVWPDAMPIIFALDVLIVACSYYLIERIKPMKCGR